MSIRGGVLVRGTSNGNSRGSAEDRRRRRSYLVATYGWRLADGTGLVCCYRCHVVLLEHEDPEAPGQGVTVDRIVPGCQGGRYVRDNIRPACGACNSETGGALARDPRTAHGACTEHAREHARTLPGNVTHGSMHAAVTGVTETGITAGQDQSRARRDPPGSQSTHASGPLYKRGPGGALGPLLPP